MRSCHIGLHHTQLPHHFPATMPKPYSEDLRRRIIALCRKGLSSREVAAQLLVSKSTVNTIYSRVAGSGDADDEEVLQKAVATRYKGRCGRPRSTTRLEDAQIAEMGQLDDLPSAPAIRRDLDLQGVVSAQTIRNRLRELRQRSRTPTQKPTLTEDNKRDRLHFCQQYQSWTAADWESVVFMDESTVELGCWGGEMRVWPLPGDDSQSIQLVQESGKFSMGVLSWMSINTLGPLLPVGGHTRAANYVKMLERDMLPWLEQEYPDGCFYLVRGCSSIRSNHVAQWLERNPSLIFLEWPSKDMDLNPIQHIWHLLKKRLLGLRFASEETLWTAIQEQWFILQQDPLTVQYLVESMPRRLEEVVRRKGGWSHY